MNLLFNRIIVVLVMIFTVTATFAAENSSEDFGKICILTNKDYKIYSIQVAHSRGAASNFESVDPNEEFKQTAEDYDSSVNVFVIEFKSDGKRIMIDCGFGAEVTVQRCNADAAGICNIRHVDRFNAALQEHLGADFHSPADAFCSETFVLCVVCFHQTNLP